MRIVSPLKATKALFLSMDVLPFKLRTIGPSFNPFTMLLLI
jgi:hypothetical protein